MSDVARELRREPLAVNPAALCRALGIDRPAAKQPSGLIVCCPAHAEKTPSCSIRVARDGTVACRCHACGWSGDAIGLVRQVYGVDFRGALEELARLTNREDLLDQRRPRLPAPRPPPPPAPVEPGISDERFDEIARALLERCPLRRDADVWAYLRHRRIAEEAEERGLGALGTGPTQQAIHAQLWARFGADLELAGLSREGRFTFSRHRLVIPWRAADGRVDTLQRRRIDAGDPRYVFPRGRRMRAPFGAELLRVEDKRPLVIVEGALDALARAKIAHRAGEDVIVVALPSASTLLERELLAASAGRRVLLALDADEAGDNAAERLRGVLREIARDVIRERGDAKDAGETLMRLAV